MSKIRARRLAKLGTPTPKPEENKAPADDASKPSSSSSTPRPQTTEADQPKPAAASSTSSTPNPFSQLGVKKDGSSQETSSSPGTAGPSRKRPATDVDDDGSPAPKTAITPPPQRKPNLPPAESDEDYANRVLSQIFRVTVDPHCMTSGGHRLTFLPNLNEELNESGDPLKLTTANLDQAILEAAGLWPHYRPLMDYLLPCWKRATKAASTSRVTSGPRFEVHEEAKRLCISNCLFSLTLPDLFG